MDPEDPAVVVPASLPVPGETLGWPRAPRRLGAGRGVDWWGEGWRVFTAAPLPWLGIAIVLILVLVALAAIPGGIGNLALGVLWPIIAGGLYLGCHALARGRPLELSHLVAGFQDGRAGGLAILGLVSLGVWLVAFLLLGVFVFGTLGASGIIGLMTGDPGVALGAAIAGAGIAALVAIPLFLLAGILFTMAWWFAVPLVALNRAGPIESLKASFDAAWRNIGAIAVFVLIYLLLAFGATLLFGLGWLLLAPVAIGANYASWREVFGE